MRFIALSLAALAAAPATARALEIDHAPLTCAAPDHYVLVGARGVPADAAVSAEVGFRLDARSPWYTVAMIRDGAAWSATLPRPTGALRQFEYRVVLTGPDASTAATAPISLRVEADCPAALGTAVASAIVVRVPPGAPTVPPVPSGFSPVGATAPGAAPRLVKKGLSATTFAVGAAVVAAGGAGAALALREEGPLVPEPDVPGFAFDRTMPPPGSTVSEPRGDRLSVVLLMSREPARPLTFEWGVELLASPAGPSCGVLAGTFADAQRLGVVLSSRVANGRCGPAFDVSVLRISVLVRGTNVFQQDVPAPFHFEI